VHPVFSIERHLRDKPLHNMWQDSLLALLLLNPLALGATGFDSAFASRTDSALGKHQSSCFAVAEDAQGRLLVAGEDKRRGQSDLMLMRFLDDGRLDRGFGDRGTFLFDGGHTDLGYDVAISPDHGILVAGSSHNDSDADAMVLRLLADGRLDPGFGTRGVMRLGSKTGGADHALSLVTDRDGGIWVAGWSQQQEKDVLRVWALDREGRLRAAFGTAGSYSHRADRNSYGFALHRTGDGRILVAGRADNGRDADALVVALTKQGLPDPNFAADGVLRIDLGGDESVYALAESLEGGLLIAGTREAEGRPSPLLLHLTPNSRQPENLLRENRLQGQITDISALPQPPLFLVGAFGESNENEALLARLGPAGLLIDGQQTGLARAALAVSVTGAADGGAVFTGWHRPRDGLTRCFRRRDASRSHKSP
jgi:uncharacterized delta-60 repeat protein